MDLVLISVADAMPAITAHFERWPDDDAPLSVEELREIVTLVTGYAEVRDALMRYVDALGGVSENRVNANFPARRRRE